MAADAYTKMLADEINEIFNNPERHYMENYHKIRDAYKNSYEWPDLDTLRHEICLCILFGLWQSSMTLTNHMLESLLKLSLTYSEHDSNFVASSDIVESVVLSSAKANKKYTDYDLGKSINQACTKGLITKEQKKQLGKYRSEYRNPYSHADRSKLYGDRKIEVQGVSLNPDRPEMQVPKEVSIFDLPMLHGLSQCYHAKSHAIPYFMYIDTLVREIKPKVFKNLE